MHTRSNSGKHEVDDFRRANAKVDRAHGEVVMRQAAAVICEILAPWQHTPQVTI